MLNKKGFTVAEVVVSFSLISVILVSIISAMMYYRDKVKEEEVITQLVDFKNNITTAVYNDIIHNNIVRIENCDDEDDCVNLIDKNDGVHVLKILKYDTTEGSNKKGVYIFYNNLKYMLPDSDLGEGNDRMCDFENTFVISNYNDDLYKLKISFYHKNLLKRYDLLFIVD